MSGAEKLYTPDVLALAVGLASYPLTDDFALLGEARSRSCGSTLKMGLMLASDGSIERVGMRVAACAIGQASAAIFASAAAGKTQAEIAFVNQALEAWLAGDAPMPEWPRLELLEAARDYPGRHGAMMLPWNAAMAALSKQETAG